MIKIKYGICIDCPEGSKEKPLTAKRCYLHNKIYRQEVAEWKKKKRAEMNEFLGIPEKPKKKPKPIAKVSEKELKRLSEYRKVRDKFMKSNPICQAKLSGCTTKATDVHHKKSRLGDLLTDTKYFMALCRSCHNKIEDGGAWVYEQGLKINRLTNN